MNLCIKILIEIVKAILFENIKAVSINCSYIQNSTFYPCLKSLVERFMTSTLMVDIFILRGEITQSSRSCFCLLRVDCVLSSLIK